MTKLERINKAIAFLKGNEIISIQQDIVDIMNVNKSSVSSALKGDDRYLTNGFLKKFCKSFPQISQAWLLNEEGEMLISKEVNNNLNLSIFYNKHGERVSDKAISEYATRNIERFIREDIGFKKSIDIEVLKTLMKARKSDGTIDIDKIGK